MDNDLRFILSIILAMTLFFSMIIGLFSLAQSASNDIECTKIREMNLPYTSLGKNFLNHETCKVILKNGGLIDYGDIQNFNLIEI